MCRMRVFFFGGGSIDSRAAIGKTQRRGQIGEHMGGTHTRRAS